MLKLVTKDGVLIDDDTSEAYLEDEEQASGVEAQTALECINAIIRQGSHLGELPKESVTGFTLIVETDSGPIVIGTGYSVQDYLSHLEQTVFKLRATILNNEGD